MARIKEITLEGNTYQVRGLTIAQIEENEGLLTTAFKLNTKEGKRDARTLLSMALLRATPTMDIDALWADYSFDYAEVKDALCEVALLSGLDIRKALMPVQTKNVDAPVPGEAQAAEPVSAAEVVQVPVDPQSA